MTDQGRGDRVSLRKSTDAVPATAGTVAAPAMPAGAGTAQRPPQASWVLTALAVAGLAALGASASLYGLHGFLLTQLTRANNKLTGSNHRTAAQVAHTAATQPGVSLVESALFVVVLLVVARAVWKGRYWSRWAVIGLFVLATFTNINGGLLQITALFADVPIALKIPVFLSSLGMIVAVALMVFVKPLVSWLNLTRPERSGTAGAVPARRGLFATRGPLQPTPDASMPPTAPSTPREPAAPRDAGAERARAKQRVTPEATSRGAAEARARAKASKSRRTGQ